MASVTFSTGGPSAPYTPKVANGAGVAQPGFDTQPILAVEALGGSALALDSSLASILAKLSADPSTGTKQSSMLTALAGIQTAIQAQIDIATLFLTDGGSPAKFYVRRESINEGTGAITVSIVNLDGSASGLTTAQQNALTPIVGAAGSGSSGPTITTEAVFFDVKTAGTGYAVGDVLARVLLTNTSTGAITASWQNMTQGTTIAAPTPANVVETTSSTVAVLQSVLTALGTPLQAGAVVPTQVFTPVRKADGTASTVRLTVGTSKTTNPVALPALAATSYRARVPASATNPVTFILTPDNTRSPVIPTAYDNTGAGGTSGDKTIDPGGVEVIGLSAAQQAAIAAGTLYLNAISTSVSEITITPGVGG